MKGKEVEKTYDGQRGEVVRIDDYRAKKNKKEIKFHKKPTL